MRLSLLPPSPRLSNKEKRARDKLAIVHSTMHSQQMQSDFDLDRILTEHRSKEEDPRISGQDFWDCEILSSHLIRRGWSATRTRVLGGGK